MVRRIRDTFFFYVLFISYNLFIYSFVLRRFALPSLLMVFLQARQILDSRGNPTVIQCNPLFFCLFDLDSLADLACS